MRRNCVSESPAMPARAFSASRSRGTSRTRGRFSRLAVIALRRSMAARNSAADNPAGSQASAKRGCIRANPAASRKTCASTSPMKTRPTVRPNRSAPTVTTRTVPPAPRSSPRMAPVAAAAPGFPRSGVSTAQKRTRSSPRAIVSPSATRHGDNRPRRFRQIHAGDCGQGWEFGVKWRERMQRR